MDLAQENEALRELLKRYLPWAMGGKKLLEAASRVWPDGDVLEGGIQMLDALEADTLKVLAQETVPRGESCGSS